ncbi:MAG: nuclear transport factor 2 family protein [Chloroflexota bacterium]|nr:nuclear transport factor 2 family protein [Chloroflexota bacterium]
MAQQDVTTLRNGYEAFNRGDIPAVLNVFDPEIEWYEPGGGRAPQGTYRGAQRVAQDVFSAVPENFDEFRAEPEQFIDARDHVVVIGRFRGKAKSGQELDTPFVHVWTMRNGKATSSHNYVSSDDWTKAWGG